MHLLQDLFLGLCAEIALYLLAGGRVPARGDPALPIGVLLSVAGDGPLADVPRSLCASFGGGGHKKAAGCTIFEDEDTALKLFLKEAEKYLV